MTIFAIFLNSNKNICQWLKLILRRKKMSQTLSIQISQNNINKMKLMFFSFEIIPPTNPFEMVCKNTHPYRDKNTHTHSLPMLYSLFHRLIIYISDTGWLTTFVAFLESNFVRSFDLQRKLQQNVRNKRLHSLTQQIKTNNAEKQTCLHNFLQ